MKSSFSFEIPIIFDAENFISIFREIGLTVDRVVKEYFFDGEENPPEKIPMWCVQNPNNTNDWILLQEIAEKYVELKKYELFFDNPDKLKIYNLFNKSAS